MDSVGLCVRRADHGCRSGDGTGRRWWRNACDFTDLVHTKSSSTWPRNQQPKIARMSPSAFSAEYRLDHKLGEGGFGVVYSCTHLVSGRVYAVKMVDRVETQEEHMIAEAGMMKMLDHPNIVKFHAVYMELCFVNIVMDIYKGDLFSGMGKATGKIHCDRVVHICAQMAAAIHYVHGRSIVHRDVKADNFLMDRQCVTDPDCCIALADFGTARAMQAGERLREECGSEAYWSPEFYMRNYGLLVDVWAMGVVAYGMEKGTFPFRNENEVRFKAPKFPERAPPTFLDYLGRLLEKNESRRISASDLMHHSWITQRAASKQRVSSVVSEAEEVEKPEVDAEQAMNREAALHNGVVERRRELVNRHYCVAKPSDQTSRPTDARMKKAEEISRNGFTIPHMKVNGVTCRFRWEDPSTTDRIMVGGQPSLSRVRSQDEENRETHQSLENIEESLRAYGVNLDLFGIGEAKTLNQLTHEVKNGVAQLMLDATNYKKLVRVVEVVLLRITAESSTDEPRYLVETDEEYSDGRRRCTNRLPGTRKYPQENSRDTAERVLLTMLNMRESMVELHFETREVFEEQSESPSYPGVTTVYLKEIIEGTISSRDNSVLSSIGLPHFNNWQVNLQDETTKDLQWLTASACTNRGVKLTAPHSRDEISALVRMPIGVSEDQLRKHLQHSGIDVAMFGRDGAKSLKDMSIELMNGDAALTTSPDGTVEWVIDRVVLWLQSKETGKILVHTDDIASDSTKTTVNALPSTTKRVDENEFAAVRRVLDELLIYDEMVSFLGNDVETSEEVGSSLCYPGLRIVERTRLMRGQLAKLEEESSFANFFRWR